MAESGGSDDGSDAGHPRETESVESLSVETEVLGFSWSAPLPTPGDLADYDRIVPGSALRILAMTEAAISGPIENARNLTNAEIEATRRGMSFAMRLTAAMATATVVFFALGIALSAAGVGGASVCIAAASVCLGIPVVMLIRSFITRS